MASEIVESAWASMGRFLPHLRQDIRKIARRLERLQLKILKKKHLRSLTKQAYIYIYIYITWTTVVKGELKALFSSATTPRCTRGYYSFPLITPLTLDLNLIMVSFKQGGIKYHSFSLWYDSSWDWTPVSRTIGKRSKYHANEPVIYIYWHHFFINTYLIDHDRHFLSTYSFVNPFELPYWSYDIRRELVDKSTIISYFPSTFCPTLGHHQGRIYNKNDVTFVRTLQLCKKCVVSIVYIFW